jgi:hypothetical protein
MCGLPSSQKHFPLKAYKSLCNAEPNVLKSYGTMLNSCTCNFCIVVFLILITILWMLLDLTTYKLTLHLNGNKSLHVTQEAYVLII